MPYKPTQPSMDLSKLLVRIAKDTSTGTLEGVRSLLAESFDWSSKQLSQLSDAPLIQNTNFGEFLSKSSESLRAAGEKTEAGLTQALTSTANAMYQALEALEHADHSVKKKLFENIPVSSIVGESFAGLVTVSQIEASFRLNGQDADFETIVEDWKRSKLEGLILCIPGLFCDEGLWNAHTARGQSPLSEVMIGEGYYPIYVRFNPGVHISSNAKSLLDLMGKLLTSPELNDKKFDVISYSQGGLILRSALYQSKRDGSEFASRIDRALIVNSPDGGSYIEKIGFWLGLGAESLPILPVSLIGFIGNQRSDAIKDLSHGIIREEDWIKNDQIGRYKNDSYFGELDDVDAYQIYSLVSREESKWSSWVGDGIVEKPSLTLLSDKVFRKKKNPESRVHLLLETSHYQVVTHPKTREILRDLLRRGI
ncbi:alpha/beta hydrolase [Leptospira gomenensis]|uniref:Alpha/beta hydrolase n=1 Tax=Leptospira gomenensis TaxID=2484974 RepID=A0A5F1YER2_9LEPT|nr:alpha/beta hydrolase [Leptospira gomenensis]TGK36058.1 alpha/beta hydrolase [Leptospira gomenensis]TGK41804.1 alpha/beta hydrolase [Leptospira gomenensis]TGK53339.1 alpha/beta hydrolase [Leptospira gomenensis]TGK64945.1 alpha/beta hydrolase [Leptospira gomenensis]